MKTTKTIACGAMFLGAMLAATTASAAVSKVICVPWQGDVFKQHTAIVASCLNAVPGSITFEILDTACGLSGTYTFYLNGVTIGVAPSDPTSGCTCSPTLNTFTVTDSGGLLSANWNTVGVNTLRATSPGNGAYVAKLRAKVNWPSTSIYTCLLDYAGDCFGMYLCDGYNRNSFDVSAPVNQCPGAVPALLKGVIKTSDTSAIYYKWVYGDGSESAVAALSGQTRYNVESSHQYTGAIGTPFTAQLVVADNNALGSATTDTYLLSLQDNTLDARINVAIDNALWWNYKQGTWYPGTSGAYMTYNGQPCVVWSSYSSYYAAPTAAAVHAFEINGSKETGNFDQDPYAEWVHYGLNWLINGVYSGYPTLQSVAIYSQHGDNPDVIGNGKGIEVRDWGYDPCYEGGQVMDAIIASGTPAADSGRDFDSSGHTLTYAQIIQEMVDMYAYGQSDTSTSFTTDTGGSSGIIGGWRYSWNADSDNSAAQWGAIGMIPAQQFPWNCIVPQWVKTYNNNWLWYSYWTDNGGTWGHFGYTGQNYAYSPGEATTPSGMVQLAFDGKTTSDSRWVNSERWVSDNWDYWLGLVSSVNGAPGIYAMYPFVKAMRVALPNPVVNLSASGLDWYRGNASHSGVAKVLSDTIINNGYYPQNNWPGSVLGNSWAVIMLKPTLFAAGPIACFTAAPNPGFSDLPISFKAACSGHSEPGKSIANLVQFSWNWGDGTPDTVTNSYAPLPHTFHCASLPCSYSVTLTVTDDVGLTATFVSTINITQPPHPPVAKPGGPYFVSLCPNDVLTLDGSASFSPDQGLHQAGCGTCPPDGITAYGWALKGAPFIYTDASTAVVNLGSGFTTYFPSAGTYNIGLQVVDNAAAAFPTGASANLNNVDFGVVNVYAAGPCQVTATPGCQSINLVWPAVTGASSYQVYGSTNGANTGFTSVGTTTSPNLTIAAGTNQPYWFRVMTVLANGQIAMSPAVAVVDTYQNCVCIGTVSTAVKNASVQLTWAPVSSATSYKVYRGAAPGVSLSGAPVATVNAGATITPVFVDNHVVNGTKYYYKVVVDIGSLDVCTSAEVSATPVAPKR